VRLSAAAYAMLLIGCDSDPRPDQWDAYIYPDLDNESREEIVSGFKTFELCQAAALDRIDQVNAEAGGAYECGYKCGTTPQHPGMWLCKETRN